MRLIYTIPLLLLLVSFQMRAQTTLNFSVTQNPSILTLNAGPNKSIANGQQAILGGSPSVSGGTSPYTYSWSPSLGLNQDNTSNPAASPVVSTVYTMTVTDSKGCSNSKSVTVTVNGVPVGIFNGYASSIKLFPNPTSGSLFISSDLIPGKDLKLEVFNSQGIPVYEDILYSSNGTLDADIDLPEDIKGLVMIKLSSNDLQVVHKIMVE
ncbi:T9SS type A sorting domain-containing protein [Sporocytophaga myxococcoides]|uniref:T9SS type A sorting domain-containing protein n=1 Tax=Sporocytophaga myxococcoides TaxID=153721 RepID=UPI0009DC2F98|nr:T9SS type A sorting domain-containing protein [Sporocytophaga myxococcoides]